MAPPFVQASVMQKEAPDFPVGPFNAPEQFTPEMRDRWIHQLAELPNRLRGAVETLSEPQLDTKYRNWTIRQIVHHIADSHINSYVRFKWALTEETPMIKAYDEGLWSGLHESVAGKIEPSLALLTGLHARWCQLLSMLEEEDFDRAFIHPETGETNLLGNALAYYAWHGEHHTGQILWVRSERFA